MPYVKINGVNLYYEIHGPENADVLVLSNGILMSTASWAYQVKVLSQFLRVLTYDCRGMWRSDHPDETYSMEQHADDLALLLKELRIDQAHIAGISYGSEISMAFAVKYPQLTQSLIVADGVSQIDPLLRAFGDTWVSAAKMKDPDLLFQVTKPLNFSEEWMAANVALMDNLALKYEDLDFEAFERLMESFLDFDITDQLRNVKSPALIFVGEKDLLKPRKYAEMIAESIPGAELAIIPSAGHASCFEQPDLFNTLILGFVIKHKRMLN